MLVCKLSRKFEGAMVLAISCPIPLWIHQIQKEWKKDTKTTHYTEIEKTRIVDKIHMSRKEVEISQ